MPGRSRRKPDRCRATTRRTGTRCRRRAVAAGLCRSHGAASPDVQRGDLRRAVRADLYGALAQDVAQLVRLVPEAREALARSLRRCRTGADLLLVGASVREDLADATAARVEALVQGEEIDPPPTRSELYARAVVRESRTLERRAARIRAESGDKGTE